MKFKLNENEEVELVYSFRTNVYFEQIQNKPIDFTNFSSNDVLVLFYCCVISSMQKAKKPIISMLDFLDAIDDYNNAEQSIVDFSNWYVGVIKAQYEVIDSIDNEKEKKETKKESKKKKN